MAKSRFLAAFIVGALAAAPTAPVADEGEGLVRLETADDSRGWEAVGRLNFGDTGFCTGALISPKLVLTAAHCLYEKETGSLVELNEMQFLVGLRDGRAEAHRGVRRAVSHPDYVFGEKVKLNRVAVDLALLELDRPVRLPHIVPFDVEYGPMEGESVGVVSYAKDRAEAPSLQRQCHVLEDKGGVAMLSCSVDFGASGAPVFRFGAEGPTIVSVVSAKADAEGERVSLASSFSGRFDELQAAFHAGSRGVFGAGARIVEGSTTLDTDPEQGSAQAAQLPTGARTASGGALNSGGATVRRMSVGGSDSGSSAKFVRP